MSCRPEEKMMNRAQLDELLLQALETERGGVSVYETAIKCALNDDLRSEWEEYLEQTKHHEQVMRSLLEQLGIDPATQTPGRAVVRHIGESLVAAMEQALAAGPPEAAQLVAGECVVNAETKDHLNWELMRTAAEKAPKSIAEAIITACDEVEDQEDEHLYHSMGWTRELWIESLGLPAVLPPPEEQKDVKTAIGAARAKNAREEMAKSK
jgi:rubrerythrin